MTGSKKNLASDVEQKRALIDFKHPLISIARQCYLLDLSRSTLYYRPVSHCNNDHQLMRLIDEEFTRHPFYGRRRMTVWLQNQGFPVNEKRVRRLMLQMGLEAIYPKQHLSRPEKWHKKYPYLLRDLKIAKPNQVWTADITYIRLAKGFVYLVAVMDWFSRYVLSWRLSNSLDASFCVDALDAALIHTSPEIFNTDQGSQFTSTDFMALLELAGVKISLDGRGRAFDNIMIERLWRNVKYEDVYLKNYQSVRDAEASLRSYFRFYNKERPHQALAYKTPEAIYSGL